MENNREYIKATETKDWDRFSRDDDEDEEYWD